MQHLSDSGLLEASNRLYISCIASSAPTWVSTIEVESAAVCALDVHVAIDSVLDFINCTSNHVVNIAVVFLSEEVGNRYFGYNLDVFNHAVSHLSHALVFTAVP